MSYYISSGRENKMYTLRYSFVEQYFSDAGTFIDRTRDYYVCTLSKFPDVAIEKAKKYVEELGFNSDEFDFSANIVLDEHGTSRDYKAEIANKTMVSGKYEGTKVEDLPVSYLKWSFAKGYGVNATIIKNYVEEYNLYEGWLNETAFKLYSKLKDLNQKIKDDIKSRVIILGQREYKQNMSDKTFTFLNNNIIRNFRDDFKDFMIKTEDDSSYNVNLSDIVISKCIMHNTNDVHNYIVAFHLCSMFKVNKPVNLLDVSFNEVLELLKNHDSGRYFIIE